jgi:hypothetical protein
MSRISPLWQIYNRNPETDDRLQLFRDPVGLRPPPPARGQDRPGVDHVALDPFGLQHPVDPEAVQTGLLDDDNREVPGRSAIALRLSSATRRSASVLVIRSPASACSIAIS